MDGCLKRGRRNNASPVGLCQVLVLLWFVAGLNVCPAQDNPSISDGDSSVFISRKTAITYGIGIHSVLAIGLEYRWWWRGNYHPFRFAVEGFLDDYSLGVDKAGHFYTSYFYFNALYNTMKWGGYDESTTMWVSVVVPALYALSLEIGDGYSIYQFAPDDLLANSLGIGYGVLQKTYPSLSNFIFKWSYYPAGKYGASLSHPLSNDYDGHIYWLSFRVHNLLPESYRNYWPKFLNLAVGYGAKNSSLESTGPMKRKFAVSLDYNLTELPLNGDTWETVKNIFDLLHFPAPGVRVIDGERAQFKPLLLN